MADVTGPTSTLPGAHRSVPKGQRCDECSNPATVRVQGETDSMGAEWYDLCELCNQKRLDAIRNEDRSGKCEWCGKHTDRRIFARDYDEGMHGPLYQVCKECIHRQNEEIQDELEYWRAHGY